MKPKVKPPMILLPHQVSYLYSNAPDKETMLALELTLHNLIRPSSMQDLTSSNVLRTIDGEPFQIKLPPVTMCPEICVLLPESRRKLLHILLPEDGRLFLRRDPFRIIARFGKIHGFLVNATILRQTGIAYALSSRPSKAIATALGYDPYFVPRKFYPPIAKSAVEEFLRIAPDPAKVNIMPRIARLGQKGSSL